jgi:hypothetical protein
MPARRASAASPGWAIAHLLAGGLTALSAVATLVLSASNAPMIALALEGMRGFLAFFGIAILCALAIGVALITAGVKELRASDAGGPLRTATTLALVLAVMAVLVASVFVFPRISEPAALDGGELHAEMASTLAWRVVSFCLQAALYPFVLLVARRGSLAASPVRGRASRRWLIAALVLALPALAATGLFALTAGRAGSGLPHGALGNLLGIVVVLGIVAARFTWPLVLVCAAVGTLSDRVGWGQRAVLWALSILAIVVGVEALAFR